MVFLILHLNIVKFVVIYEYFYIKAVTKFSKYFFLNIDEASSRKFLHEYRFPLKINL